MILQTTKVTTCCHVLNLGVRLGFMPSYKLFYFISYNEKDDAIQEEGE